MEKICGLYADLILAFLGLVAPIVVIIFSLFNEGAKKLAKQYEDETALNQSNIKEQLRKISEMKRPDTAEIRKTIDELETAKSKAEEKLSYLNPQTQILWLFVPLLVAYFIAGFACYFHPDAVYSVSFLVVSIVSFSVSIFRLWESMGIIVEVQKLIDGERVESETRLMDLIADVVDAVKKSPRANFLKNIWTVIGPKKTYVKDNSVEIKLIQNTKSELYLSVDNDETIMAEKVELGLIFPSHFLIGKAGEYTVLVSGTDQIVRLNVDSIHAKTNLLPNPLIVTPLKAGTFKVKTFLKARNIEAKYNDIKFVIQ